MRLRTTTKKGTTLIEALVFSMIFVIVSMSFYRTFNSGLRVLRDAKARLAATEILNERFEILRNLAYEKLGIVNGDPAGDIPQIEYVTRSGTLFKITTNINYVDDNYDGDGGSDDRPNDYKNIDVEVSWGAGVEGKKISMVSHIAPPGTEELYNGGILNIDIRQTDGTPVQGARVIVTNMLTGVDIYNRDTGSDGKAYLIGLTPGDKIYRVSVTKNGYENVTTMAPYPTSAYDPVDEHGSVVLAGIWPQTLIFDQFANTHLRAVDPLGNQIGDISFSIEGGRKLGDAVGPVPVFSYTRTDHTTNSSGEFDLATHSPGMFIFQYPDTGNNANYKFWKVNPVFAGDATRYYANPGVDNTVGIVLLPKSTPSLFVTAVDKIDGTPISGANVEVKNDPLAYDKTATTDQFGKVYFPDNSGPLQNDSYEVTVKATGYQDKIETISVSNLTEPTIQLEPNP